MLLLAMLVGPPAGKLFAELYDAVKNAIKGSVAFKSELEKMKSTLHFLIPLVKEIDQFNQEFDRRKEEAGKLMEIIIEGKELVLKCSEVKIWERKNYTNKLRKLEQSLNSYFQIVVQAQILRDAKENQRELKDISLRLNELTSFIPGHNPNGFTPSCAPPLPLENPVGFNEPLGELKMELFKEHVSTVVLSAPAGCGKTTLAALLCHDKEVKEKFKDNIFFIPVSQKLNLKAIVRRIFEYKRCEVPQFLNDQDLDMIYQLQHFFEQLEPKPLIILDDVWPESESILDKLNFKILGYKVLVTSRLDFPKYGSIYKLKPLDDDDAMTLFCNAAFLEGQISTIPEDVVKKIVKACKRFPIALTTVGKSLCRQAAEIWATRELELSKIGSIFKHGDLLNCLKMSFNALDNELSVKECFMDLCSFPEDQRIPVTTLIDMWEELYKLEVPDQDGVIAVSNLHTLARGNLLDFVITRKGTSGCYLWHFVTQHDLFRELTICESKLESVKETKRFIVDIRANDVPDWWMAKETSISSHLLSISTDENFSSSWCNLNAPEVEVLVLNLQSENYSLPKFIAIMEKLKVLVVMNYGCFLPQLEKFHLLAAPSSLRRIRMERVLLPSSSFTSIKLENLWKITLVMCSISKAFGKSIFQLSKSLPNVVEIVIDCCNDLISFPVEICQLTKLKKLSIIDCHYLEALPKEIGNLETLKVLRLCYCIKLSGLPSTIGSLLGLRDLDISGCSDIKGLPEEFGKLRNLKKFHMAGCSKIPNLPQTIKNLEHLEKVICDEENSSLWKHFTPLLKKLEIQVYKEESTLDWLFK